MSTTVWIYLATNSSMPRLVKIGRSRNHPKERMQQLDTTGVPTPFICAYTVLVEDHEDVESKLHQQFAFARVNKNREFFTLSVAEVVRAIRDRFTTLYEEVADKSLLPPEPSPVEERSELECMEEKAELPTVSEPKSHSVPHAIEKPKPAHSRSVQAVIDRASREAAREIEQKTLEAKRKLGI